MIAISLQAFGLEPRRKKNNKKRELPVRNSKSWKAELSLALYGQCMRKNAIVVLTRLFFFGAGVEAVSAFTAISGAC